MAKIIKKGNDLEKEFVLYQNQIKQKGLYALLFFFISIISSAVCALTNQIRLLILPFILWIITIIFIKTAVTVKQKMNILQSGIEGEYLTNSQISSLPETYTAFRNLTVTYNHKSSELDTLIIGPTGVFVVETKNLNGTITGNISEHNWIQHKIGRAGTPYSKTFYSPVKQVNTHIYRIANFLKENGIRTYINAIVYFSNIDTTVSISGSDEKTHIFFAKNDGANQMLQHILNNNQQLSEADCNKIIDLLNNA